MGDMGDAFKEFREAKRALLAEHGVACPRCAIARPKTNASILLPQQKCRVDGYRDPRARLTDEQREAAPIKTSAGQTIDPAAPWKLPA